MIAATTPESIKKSAKKPRRPPRRFLQQPNTSRQPPKRAQTSIKIFKSRLTYRDSHPGVITSWASNVRASGCSKPNRAAQGHQEVRWARLGMAAPTSTILPSRVFRNWYRHVYTNQCRPAKSQRPALSITGLGKIMSLTNVANISDRYRRTRRVSCAIQILPM